MTTPEQKNFSLGDFQNLRAKFISPSPSSPPSSPSSSPSESFDVAEGDDWGSSVVASLAGSAPKREDIDDYTDFALLRKHLVLFAIQVIDQALALVINSFSLALFSTAWFLFAPFSRILETFLNWFKKKVTTKVSSFVTLSTPDIFDTLPEKAKKFEPTTREFSEQNALFLLGLSTLVYEDNQVIDQNLKKIRAIEELGHAAAMKESCVFHAFWSVKKNFLVLTFKGTSPVNLVEWLSDLSLTKVAADSHILPGEVHEGFYNAFEFPLHIHKHKHNPGAEASSRARPARHYERINQIVFDILEKEFKGKVPEIWITGHSLGAALASVYYSFALCGDVALFPVLGKLRKGLVGAYTFGTPRTGNNVYMEEVKCVMKEEEKVFYRIANANDIICVTPIGGNTIFRSVLSSAFSDDAAVNLMSLTDYHHIGAQIVFPYYGDHCRCNRVGLVKRVKDVIGYSIDNFLAWGRLIGGSETLYSAVLRQMTPFFVFDHFPSEYERHIQKHIKPNFTEN